MSDIADRAEWRITKDLQIALQLVRRAEILESNGHCCFCDGPVPYPGRFCNVDCRDDFDKKQSSERRLGR